jgi:two-component system, OmpR family, sensor histidine kinase BaeS
MSLASRLLLTVGLTAVFSASLTGYLSYRAASERVPRAFGMAMGHGPGGMAAGEGRGMAAAPAASGAAVASHLLLGELQDVTVRAAGIALAVALAAGGFIAFRSTRPIAHLADVTRRYGAGERDLRALPVGRDEVAALARVFNATADRLQAEEAQRVRFTTDVAHELRTPLTVLKSELEAVQDGVMTADAETVAGLLGEVDLLTRLVNDLRLLTLAESRELVLERGPVALDQVATAAARAFQSRAHGAHVRVDVDAEPVQAWGDPDRLHQVVNALLDNALRHAGSPGLVRVRTERSGHAAVLEVSDDGPGIPPEHRAHVFERFYRVDASRGRASGGSGLGLAIVAAIVDLHGGRVEALDRDGGGATFRVTLPTGGPAPAST